MIFLENYARRQLGKGEDWRIYLVERVESRSTLRLTGCKTFKRHQGPLKGTIRFAKFVDRAILEIPFDHPIFEDYPIPASNIQLQR